MSNNKVGTRVAFVFWRWKLFIIALQPHDFNLLHLPWSAQNPLKWQAK
jgi:hypothetical protein